MFNIMDDPLIQTKEYELCTDGYKSHFSNAMEENA